LIGGVADGWSQSAKQDLARAEQLLLDVFHIDGGISYARTALGVLRRLQGRLNESQIELETATGLASNNPTAIGQLGLTLALQGRPEAAIPLLERSIRLAPYDPGTPFSHFMLGACHLLLDHIEESIICIRKARAGNPRLYYAHLALAAALGLKGDLEEASAALGQAREIRPEIGSLSDMRASFANPDFVTLFERTMCVGLRRAGVLDE
jgi:adenylate cyclase